MKKLALIVLLLVTYPVMAQLPTLEWVARYHNTYSSSLSLSSDLSGNIFISGVNFPGSSNQSRFLTLKYNNLGILQWSRFYRGNDTMQTSASDVANKNINDAAGNIYVAGRSYNNLNGADIFIIKYNTNGDSIWTIRYDGPANSTDIFADMLIDKFANIYVIGQSVSQQFDYVTLKYDSSGNKLWEARYPHGYATGVAIDSLYNVYVTGTAYNGPFFKYSTIKYNSLGIQQWVSDYAVNYNAEATAIVVDTMKNVYVTGFVGAPNFEDYSTIKYSPSGIQLWQKQFSSTINNSNADKPNELLLDKAGNLFVIGYPATIKYDHNGNIIWIDSLAIGSNAVLDYEGNLYETGSKNDANQFFWIESAKYNVSGNKVWSMVYGRRQNELISSSGICTAGNSIYVLGNAYRQPDQDSIILIKYSQPIGISGNNNEVPKAYRLYQNFPNPFNPVTKIYYTLPTAGKIKITIYNALGESVDEILNSYKEKGVHITEFNGSDLPSGIYFYRLEATNFALTKKMVLVK